MEAPASLERSISQQSHTSRRSATLRAPKSRKRLSQPSSSASSISPSDKSLTSFPSFSPEEPSTDRFEDCHGLQSVIQEPVPTNGMSFKTDKIVDSLTGNGNDTAARDSLFEEVPVAKVPGALHQADDGHINRLIDRHGAVGLVRRIAEDLAQRDAQIATLRRRADERETALRRIIRECGLSNLELETKLRAVEETLRDNGRTRDRANSGLSDLMTDAMGDSVAGRSANGGEGQVESSNTIRAMNTAATTGKGNVRGWKEFFWGTGTTKKSSRGSSISGEGINATQVGRSYSSMDRRLGLQDDLFTPPDAVRGLARSSSGASLAPSVDSERKPSGSLASLALRLVAGGAGNTRECESRGRAISGSARPESVRAPSSMSQRTSQSASAASVPGGPKALMAMRRTTPAPPTATTKMQHKDPWGGSGDGTNSNTRQESYGPVEMDAILPPESQPPTLTHIYKNYEGSEYLTDRFGFIYDQRRKKRQREAAQIASHVRRGSCAAMLINGRTSTPSSLPDDATDAKSSISESDGRPASPGSLEESKTDEGKGKRWQDYLKIATFPTELLSHTPSIAVPSLEVLEAPQAPSTERQVTEPLKSPAVITTNLGLVPAAITATAGTITAVATDTALPVVAGLAESNIKEDREPVKLLLQQLSEVHDATQRERTPRWNDFLRKVRAERRREGEAAVAAANAMAEARYERPAVILPETRVADGEMIGISSLGMKGKVGRAKWSEFKGLVLGGIPVAFRPKVWTECSGAAVLRIPGYYEDLVAQTGEDDDPTIISQIQMDIHRTLTDNIFFRKGPGVQKLREVLVAYARRNKDVGYCQGMNLITANLLLMMPSAEDAFWILASIVENILPEGYYDHSLISSRADQQVLRQYVSTVLPKLSLHLDSLSIELEALTFQWFLSVFTDCLCAEALFRVWDVVLCTNDGSTFLFQVALALLKLNEGNLLKCVTAAEVYTYLSHQMTEHAISIDGLLQASEGLRKVVRREDVEGRREKVMQRERDGLKPTESE